MADEPDKQEKTEEASPRRLEEAREKGQTAFSSEVMAATTLVAALLTFALVGPMVAEAAGHTVAVGARQVGELGPVELDLEDFAGLVSGAVRGVLPAILALVLPVVLLAVLVGFAQVGGLRLAPKAIAPQWSKLDPVAGFKRMFGPRAWVRTLLSAVKLIVLGAAVVLTTWDDVLRVGNLAGGDLGPALSAVGTLLGRAAIAGVLAVLALSLFDFWFQRQQFGRDMRMTRKELKDEHKSSEGDPIVKSRIRQVQREISARRMMADVPNATVVVTNPTHFAVALRYEHDGAGAPRVVAKGVDQIAERIKSVAREHGVLVYEDPLLARALHRTCEIGDEIPEDLFQAVAGVLAYVYRVQGGAPITA